ncbi:MAG: hypothetical protein HY021_07240, partial [Burkholderiales bacterium]|nr:hypothetical protein [Burkholderiales bacterium]
MKRWCACAALLAASHAFGAEAVGPALDRPAQTVRAPERAVLIAAAALGPNWI